MVGADVDTLSLLRAREKLDIETVVLDAHGDWLELGDQKFDVIVAGEILEHLFFPAKIVRKAVSHLKKGGVFIGSVPNAFSLKNRIRYLFAMKKNTPLADPTHINQFSAHDLKEMLSSEFKSVEIGGLGKYERFAATFPNLCAFDLVFIAKKI